MTLLLVVLAVMIHALPALGPALVYEREAILAGQIWRLFTGHWVHFSNAHLCIDAVVLALAGGWLEKTDPKTWRRMCLIAPWIIGLALLTFQPRLATYGGLSGLAAALVVALALNWMREPSVRRWIGGALIAGLVVKVMIEIGGGTAWTTGEGASGFAPVPLSHIMGGLTAWVLNLRLGRRGQSVRG